MNLAFGAIDDSFKLKNLRRNAGWVMKVILCSANHLALVVDARGKAVVASQCRKWRHYTPLPYEPATLMVSSGRREKGGATPPLSVSIHIGNLRYTCDLAPAVFYGPLDGTVGSSESAKVQL